MLMPVYRIYSKLHQLHIYNSLHIQMLTVLSVKISDITTSQPGVF